MTSVAIRVPPTIASGAYARSSGRPSFVQEKRARTITLDARTVMIAPAPAARALEATGDPVRAACQTVLPARRRPAMRRLPAWSRPLRAR